MIVALHNGMRELLSMMVALATVTPAPVRHLHAGGEHPHWHDADGHVHYGAEDLAATMIAEDDDYGHGHSHHGDLHHEEGDHHDACVSDSRLLASAANHWHLLLFGLNVMLPVPPGGQDGDEDDQGAMRWLGLAAGDNVSLQMNEGPAESISLDMVQVASAVPTLCTVEFHASPQRIAAPLCDAARHERSGVQLI